MSNEKTDAKLVTPMEEPYIEFYANLSNIFVMSFPFCV
jgi:hypothetical protein